jgi:hypothetical protein
VGRKKNPTTQEAIFFQQINKWLLASCGGGLENPTPIKWLLEDQELRVITTDFIRYVLRTPKAISYLGIGNYLKCRTPENLTIPWGWKDPRNTFTLPIWSEIFPNRKVIHVYRHGVDVSNSLKTKNELILSSIKRRTKKFGKLHWLYWTWNRLPKRNELVHVRSSFLDGGFSLWEEYLSEARRHINSLGEKGLDVKFEALMENPRQILREMVEFCELQVSGIRIEEAIGLIKSQRAYAYISDEKLQKFSDNVRERLSLYGY